MPGTPATTPRLALPRYANSDPADFATDVNAIVDRLDIVTGRIVDIYANRPATATALNGLSFVATDKAMEWQCVSGAWVLVNVLAPEVTSLPTGPIDQQECVYVADITAGIKHHLKYRAASTSSFKWERIGGPPLHASSAIDIAPASGTWLEPSPVCRVTLPLAGDYMVEYGMTGGGNAGQNLSQGVKIGAANPGGASTGQQAPIFGSASNVRMASTRRFRLNAAAAATVLAWVFANDVNLTGNVAAPFLSATPIRVG
jgi:hypothetical protein